MCFVFVVLLLMACFSPPKSAGNAVKRASDNLVRAAQKAAFDKADDNNVVVKTKFVGGIAQVRIRCFVTCLPTTLTSLASRGEDPIELGT